MCVVDIYPKLANTRVLGAKQCEFSVCVILYVSTWLQLKPSCSIGCQAYLTTDVYLCSCSFPVLISYCTHIQEVTSEWVDLQVAPFELYCVWVANVPLV